MPCPPAMRDGILTLSDKGEVSGNLVAGVLGGRGVSSFSIGEYFEAKPLVEIVHPNRFEVKTSTWVDGVAYRSLDVDSSELIDTLAAHEDTLVYRISNPSRARVELGLSGGLQVFSWFNPDFRSRIAKQATVQFDCERVEGHVHIDIVNYEHAITRGLPLGHCFGPDISRWHMALFKESGFIEDDPSFMIGPLFSCSDPEAITLGILNSTGKPGLCVKRFEDWTSIFAATPFVSKEVLRKIAEYAGVHLYSDRGDLVYSNKHFLSICPRVGGKRTIRLPEPKSVTDLWSGEKLAAKAESLEIDAIANRTYMYLLE